MHDRISCTFMLSCLALSIMFSRCLCHRLSAPLLTTSSIPSHPFSTFSQRVKNATTTRRKKTIPKTYTVHRQPLARHGGTIHHMIISWMVSRCIRMCASRVRRVQYVACTLVLMLFIHVACCMLHVDAYVHIVCAHAGVLLYHTLYVLLAFPYSSHPISTRMEWIEKKYDTRTWDTNRWDMRSWRIFSIRMTFCASLRMYWSWPSHLLVLSCRSFITLVCCSFVLCRHVMSYHSLPFPSLC